MESSRGETTVGRLPSRSDCLVDSRVTTITHRADSTVASDPTFIARPLSEISLGTCILSAVSSAVATFKPVVQAPLVATPTPRTLRSMSAKVESPAHSVAGTAS